jgi:hypothetical protein
MAVQQLCNSQVIAPQGFCMLHHGVFENFGSTIVTNSDVRGGVNCVIADVEMQLAPQRAAVFIVSRRKICNRRHYE